MLSFSAGGTGQIAAELRAVATRGALNLGPTDAENFPALWKLAGIRCANDEHEVGPPQVEDLLRSAVRSVQNPVIERGLSILLGVDRQFSVHGSKVRRTRAAAILCHAGMTSETFNRRHEQRYHDLLARLADDWVLSGRKDRASQSGKVGRRSFPLAPLSRKSIDWWSYLHDYRSIRAEVVEYERAWSAMLGAGGFRSWLSRSYYDAFGEHTQAIPSLLRLLIAECRFRTRLQRFEQDGRLWVLPRPEFEGPLVDLVECIEARNLDQRLLATAGQLVLAGDLPGLALAVDRNSALDAVKGYLRVLSPDEEWCHLNYGYALFLARIVDHCFYGIEPDLSPEDVGPEAVQELIQGKLDDRIQTGFILELEDVDLLETLVQYDSYEERFA